MNYTKMCLVDPILISKLWRGAKISVLFWALELTTRYFPAYHKKFGAPIICSTLHAVTRISECFALQLRLRYMYLKM